MGPIPYRGFFGQWSGILSLPSIFTLYDWTRRENAGGLRPGACIDLTLKRPKTQVALRESTSDVWTFREIFGNRVYRGAGAVAGPDCRSVLDLGANIGIGALYFLSLFPGARIGAVEPDRSNCAMLAKNLARFIAARQCSILRGAAWCENVERLWVDPRADHNAKTVGTFPTGDPVPGYSMPALLDYFAFETVDLLKMDIEGAESAVFRNADLWLDRTRVLAIEFHYDARQVSGFDDHMRRHGFHISAADEHTVVACRTVN
jgi:FkbM family methyltransferase